jgi:translation initiation factor 2-alpha kinase 4
MRSDCYRSSVSGHPRVTKAAVIDIISPDRNFGPTASAAELLVIVNDCLNSFPDLGP